MAPFLAPFWSHFGSQVRHYTLFWLIFNIFWEGTPLKVADGRPRRLGDDFVMIFDRFGSALGGPRRGTLGVLWAFLFEADLFKAIRSDMFSDSETEVKMELPKGVWTCNPITPVYVF